MKKLFTILLVLILLTSCKDNTIDDFELYPGLELNDISWSNNPIEQSKTNTLVNDLVLETKSLTFNQNVGATWNLNPKTQIVFPANSYSTSTGGSVTGNITTDVVLLNKKGDFIRNLLPSVTESSIVEYGANCFFVNLRTNSIEEAKLKNGYFITINIKDTTATSSTPQVLAFSETIIPLNNNNPKQWFVNNLIGNGSLQFKPNLPISDFGSKQGFEIKTNKSGLYLTTAKEYTPPSTTSRVDVVLPANFTNKNTLVFAVFKNKNIVLRLSPDASSKSFFYNKMPTSEDVSFISISVIDNKIYYGVNAAKITPNGVFRVSPDVNPITTTKLKTYLDLL